MGIFIVEEMHRTGEIRLEDDKDLGLTQAINRCLQMIKADRSKQTQSFSSVPLNCLEVPHLVAAVLSPSSGTSPARVFPTPAVPDHNIQEPLRNSLNTFRLIVLRYSAT